MDSVFNAGPVWYEDPSFEIPPYLDDLVYITLTSSAGARLQTLELKDSPRKVDYNMHKRCDHDNHDKSPERFQVDGPGA